MNDRQLEYMLTILKEGSISKAAEVLCISQPSLSQMVRKIEKETGAELFSRHSNPISLTPAGECYIRAARNILAIRKNMETEIQELHTGVRGTLRLGVPVQRGMEIVPFFLPKFHEKYPLVKVELVETGSDDLENLLLQGDLHLACLTTSAKSNSLDYLLVAVEQIVLLASRSTALAKRIPSGQEIDISDAKDETFICIRRGHSVRVTQDSLFDTHHIRPKILFETSSIEVAKRSVPACGAVMLIPRNYIDINPELYDSCSIYPVREINQERHFYICRPKGYPLTLFEEDFIRIFRPDLG